MHNEDYCFVIMPFNNKFAGVYLHAIKPAVESMGLKCIRVDEIDGTGNIVRKIVELIAKAKVVIADLTDRNPNVFYELGIVHSLGNNTIVITRDIKEVPFDVKSYRVIEYEDSIEGGIMLKNNLLKDLETLEAWSTSPNNPVQDFLPEHSRSVTIGQYHNVVTELNEAKDRLNNAQKHLKNYENKLGDYEKMKENYSTLQDKAKELEIIYTLLNSLGLINPAGGSLNSISEMKEIISRVDKEGQVSIPVKTEKGDSTDKKRITFTRVE